MDNSGPMRYATYARYSSDLQRQSSIEDQIRKCHEYGQSQGWIPASDGTFTDEASTTTEDHLETGELVSDCHPRDAAARVVCRKGDMEPFPLYESARN